MVTTKDLVLSFLKAANGFVSGSGMSGEIGVSRAAVNAAVKALRSDGYEIESVTNRGYRLLGGAEKLSVGEMLSDLGVDRAKRVTVLESVGSTNTELKSLCAQGKAGPGDCLIANMQTSGRGRLGRSFESPQEQGIYLSCVLNAKGVTPLEVSEVTAWGAVAVRAAIEEISGVSCGVKWVNDLVCGTRKVCGILTELTVEGESGSIRELIMGIGINVNQEPDAFPPEIEKIATSLRAVCGRPISRAKLCAAVIRRMDRLCEDFPRQREDYLSQYRSNCVNLGKPVAVLRGSETRRGTALEIDAHFNLVVRYDTGETEAVHGGEVSLGGFYGAR